MLNVLSLFSGIGAFERAFENVGIPFELLAYCERDPDASKSYSLIHGVPEDMNLRDVMDIDFLSVDEVVDFICYGFPCQDISNGGLQKGFFDENGERTRSGLFFEALRIIDDYRPKFAIAENVKALTHKKFTAEFNTVLESLEALGYVNYWAVLNGKDFGIPQNRERIFIVSIRKDIDRGFTFPSPIPLTLRLKDLLDDEVEERYYLSDETTKQLLLSAKVEIDSTARIRNITPIERFRLMGFTDTDYIKCLEGGVDERELEKQTGNSIIVPVIEAIYRSLGAVYEEFQPVN